MPLVSNDALGNNATNLEPICSRFGVFENRTRVSDASDCLIEYQVDIFQALGQPKKLSSELLHSSGVHGVM